MARKKKTKKKNNLLPIIPVIVLVLIFFFAFFNEIKIVVGFWWWVITAIPKVILGMDIGVMSRGDDFYQVQRIVRFNLIIGLGFVFVFWLFLAALQSLLPISSIREIFSTMRIVFRHFRGKQVRIARVVGGHNVSPEEKMQRKKKFSFITNLMLDDEDKKVKFERGVILLDSDSAIALEEMTSAPDLVLIAWRWLLRTLRLLDDDTPRVCGPGLIFIHPWERVHSFVDLRKQIRSETEVVALTGDGIEIRSFVFSLFSVGRQPKPLQLAYNDGLGEENFQAVTFFEEKGRLCVTGFKDDLAQDDRSEAYHFARAAGRMGELGAYFNPQDPGVRPVYDPNRVFNAVYARARNGSSDLIRWDDLPLIFTKDAFKEMASQFNFDEMSNPIGKTCLMDFKQRVNTAVRNLGVLTYSVVVHQSGEPLKKGNSYDPAELLSSPVRDFTTPKVLRERGIMNIYSAFTAVTPCPDAIYQQRLDNWQARLQRDIDMVTARRELEVRNIYSRARSQAQQELSTALNDILKDRQYSEEAMALLVFQALEEYACNPETRQRLPNEVITLLRNLHDRILPPGTNSFPFLRD
ncbi:MAG: hypothetical protein K8R77_00630 [Anaerolineaceae bacterium]|nr:hypothetical protein [Anaerolineaceae bacterium]